MDRSKFKRNYNDGHCIKQENCVNSYSCNNNKCTYNRNLDDYDQKASFRVPVVCVGDLDTEHLDEEITRNADESLTDDEKRAKRLDKSIKWLRQEVVSNRKQGA